MSSRFFASVLTRLKQITQSESDAQLARALGVSPQTLSSWKVRDSIPYSLCVDIARQHACSLDWLLMGERGRTLHTAEGWEDDMLERLRSLSRTDREATLLYIKDKQRIQALEKKLDALAYRLPNTSEG
ncbi:helix-turn-helix domain-containing protein [Pseudomonas sp. NPDC089758]|uniref:helix-turn-helix domain-containing protein n=1 Tax=Pseudomonas sp. NPDC089758 TaxID=3364473 RepID=UPI00381B1ED0